MAKRLHKEEKGFTLIELIVVVAILGMLATIVVPKVTGGVISKSKTNSAKATEAILKNALERYYVDNETYPPEDELDSLEGKYVESIPNDYEIEYIPDDSDKDGKYDSYSLSVKTKD
jgi:type II secretion system protein G